VFPPYESQVLSIPDRHLGIYNLQRGFGNKTVASSRNDKHRQCSVVTARDAQRQSDRRWLLTAEIRFSSLVFFWTLTNRVFEETVVQYFKEKHILLQEARE